MYLCSELFTFDLISIGAVSKSAVSAHARLPAQGSPPALVSQAQRSLTCLIDTP